MTPHCSEQSWGPALFLHTLRAASGAQARQGWKVLGKACSKKARNCSQKGGDA